MGTSKYSFASKLAAALLSVSLISCASFHTRAPAGFAAYEKSPGHTFRAVDPEGVLFRVRSEKQKKTAHISFWKQALRLRMEQSGYRTTDSTALTVAGKSGASYEFQIPQGQSDQTFLVAFVPKGKKIIIFEASGEVSLFAKRRADILEAIAKSEL